MHTYYSLKDKELQQDWPTSLPKIKKTLSQILNQCVLSSKIPIKSKNEINKTFGVKNIMALSKQSFKDCVLFNLISTINKGLQAWHIQTCLHTFLFSQLFLYLSLTNTSVYLW